MQRLRSRVRGLGLLGLIFWVIVLGYGVSIVVKIVPTVTEFASARRVLDTARVSASTAVDLRSTFDRLAQFERVTSVKGADLDVVPVGSAFRASFAYEKRFEIAGPVSLVIDYAATSPR